MLQRNADSGKTEILRFHGPIDQPTDDIFSLFCIIAFTDSYLRVMSKIVLLTPFDERSTNVSKEKDVLHNPLDRIELLCEPPFDKSFF